MHVGSREGRTRRRAGLLGFGIALLAFVALPANAQEDEPAGDSERLNYARTGLYIGLVGVYAIEQFESPIVGGNSLGWSPWVGYRFHPRGAIEAQIESLNGFKFDDPRISSSIKKKIEPTIWTVNGKYYFMTERIQPYALVGAGLLLPGTANPYFTVPSSGAPGSPTIDSAFTMKFGGGLDYYLTENLAIAVNAVYTMLIGNGLPEQIPYVSVGWGFEYHFHFAE